MEEIQCGLVNRKSPLNFSSYKSASCVFKIEKDKKVFA